MSEPRTWEMWAGLSHGVWSHAHPDARFVKAYGCDPVRVILTEEPEGEHYGWIRGASEALEREADDHPSLVQPRWSMFTMQFPYGPEAEAERGRGEIVRLRIEEVPASTTA